jgi:hypothetical protein
LKYYFKVEYRFNNNGTSENFRCLEIILSGNSGGHYTLSTSSLPKQIGLIYIIPMDGGQLL